MSSESPVEDTPAPTPTSQPPDAGDQPSPPAPPNGVDDTPTPTSQPPDAGDVPSPPPPLDDTPTPISQPPDEGEVPSPPPPPSGLADTPTPPPISQPADAGGLLLGPTPPNRGGTISVGVVAGVVVGVVALVVVVVILVVFLRKRRRQQPSPSSMPENQMSSKSKGTRDEEAPLTADNTNPGSTTPREGLTSSPLQSPTIPQDHFQLPQSQRPQSQLHSITRTPTLGSSSSASIVDVGVRRFDYKELSDVTSQFSPANIIGRGGFGLVFKGDFAGDDGATTATVAIKQLQTGSSQGEREFITEIRVVGRIHHRNLVSLDGYCISGSERLLVYEYVKNNDLASNLKGNGTTLLDWDTRLSIALGAAKGISYLHEECNPRIIHRDIKSTNILLDSHFKAKVADFGLARFLPDGETHLILSTRVMGTFGYIAPEVWTSKTMTEKSDVYSFGIVLLELISGREPQNLAHWASPFLKQALENGVFEAEFIDPKLGGDYDHGEMIRMVTCAATSVYPSPDDRPKMSQVVQVLEGNISSDRLIVLK